MIGYATSATPFEPDLAGASDVLTGLPKRNDMTTDHKSGDPLGDPNVLHFQLLESAHVLRHVKKVPHDSDPTRLQHSHHFAHHSGSLRRRLHSPLPVLLPHRVHEHSRHHHVEVVIAERQAPDVAFSARHVLSYSLDLRGAQRLQRRRLVPVQPDDPTRTPFFLQLRCHGVQEDSAAAAQVEGVLDRWPVADRADHPERHVVVERDGRVEEVRGGEEEAHGGDSSYGAGKAGGESGCATWESYAGDGKQRLEESAHCVEVD